MIVPRIVTPVFEEKIDVETCDRWKSLDENVKVLHERLQSVDENDRLKNVDQNVQLLLRQSLDTPSMVSKMELERVEASAREANESMRLMTVELQAAKDARARLEAELAALAAAGAAAADCAACGGCATVGEAACVREAERRAAEREEALLREAEPQQAERQEAERAERQSALAERHQAERQDAVRREAERQSAEKVEAERREIKCLEAERHAADLRWKAERRRRDAHIADLERQISTVKEERDHYRIQLTTQAMEVEHVQDLQRREAGLTSAQCQALEEELQLRQAQQAERDRAVGERDAQLTQRSVRYEEARADLERQQKEFTRQKEEVLHEQQRLQREQQQQQQLQQQQQQPLQPPLQHQVPQLSQQQHHVLGSSSDKENRQLRQTIQQQKKSLAELEDAVNKERAASNFLKPSEFANMARSHQKLNANVRAEISSLGHELGKQREVEQVLRRNLAPEAMAQVERELQLLSMAAR